MGIHLLLVFTCLLFVHKHFIVRLHGVITISVGFLAIWYLGTVQYLIDQSNGACLPTAHTCTVTKKWFPHYWTFIEVAGGCPGHK